MPQNCKKKIPAKAFTLRIGKKENNGLKTRVKYIIYVPAQGSKHSGKSCGNPGSTGSRGVIGLRHPLVFFGCAPTGEWGGGGGVKSVD